MGKGSVDDSCVPYSYDDPFDRVVFDLGDNYDVSVAARAISIQTGIANAIFRAALQIDPELDTVFGDDDDDDDDSVGFLALTESVYVCL